MSFRMQYEDVPIMREQYRFLESSSDAEVISLLAATCTMSPDDKDFANACRLELMYRDKQRT